VIARSGDVVANSDYRWHDQPDGGACFEAEGGGYIYVSNSEIGDGQGGVGAVRFDAASNVIDAYRILDGTNRNCSGGATPWGTWLSCEEAGDGGQVFECDPAGLAPARRRAAMGSFNHEAVEVIESARALFMTEDRPDGRLYRFIPDSWPGLDHGRLQAASVDQSGAVRWVDVADDRPDRSGNTSSFNGGEGLASSGGDLFISTKGDRRLWRYDTHIERIEVIHDCIRTPDTVLDSVDNLTVDPGTGDLFVAEDGATQDLAIVTATSLGALDIAAFIRFEGHESSEVTGPALSPDRASLVVSSQRGTDGRGITYAVTGPFRSPSDPSVPVTTTPRTTQSTFERSVERSGLRRAVRTARG